MAAPLSPPGEPASQRGALVFIGFMGAGKSTAARAVAAALGVQALDSDELLERQLGHAIAEEFQRNGEQHFRAVEEQLVCELLERADERTVLSLGGGSVLSDAVRARLRSHVAVLLDVDPQTAWQRTNGQSGTRPLVGELDQFQWLFAQRSDLYFQIADAIVPAGKRSTVTDALPALLELRQTPVDTRLLWAAANAGSYPVFLGSGLLSAGFWPFEKTRRFVVSDRTVAGLYMPALGDLQMHVSIEPGEQHKTLQSAELVWRALARAGMRRGDQLVGLGGGVVGDLAGFCAATYQRGVPIVHIPTTLVAQVDSAYGGKTGVDLPEAKNYIGAYHQPSGVLVDPTVLKTLPDAERNAGYAEVLKTALIAGGELWRRVAAEEPLDDEMIRACVHTKLTVVGEDERDGGRRQVLNLGHTIGHAIETVTGYRRLRHGEAVGLGLLAALRLSGLDQLRQQVRELLEAHQLPVAIDEIDAREVLQAAGRDKKRVGAEVPFVVVRQPGDVTHGVVFGEDEILSAVNELITECR